MTNEMQHGDAVRVYEKPSMKKHDPVPVVQGSGGGSSLYYVSLYYVSLYYVSLYRR